MLLFLNSKSIRNLIPPSTQPYQFCEHNCVSQKRVFRCFKEQNNLIKISEMSSLKTHKRNQTSKKKNSQEMIPLRLYVLEVIVCNQNPGERFCKPAK